MRRKALDYTLISIWLAAIFLGLQALWRYEKTAAATNPEFERQWPRGCRLSLKEGKTLMVFVHPKCPCTKAGLRELISLSQKERLDGYICAVVPADAPTDWLDDEFCRECKKIYGLQLLSDSKGQISKEFAASCSGEIFLFDKTGTLKFHGGINLARGHEGANDGLSSLQLALKGNEALESYPVYGCALLSSSEASR